MGESQLLEASAVSFAKHPVRVSQEEEVYETINLSEH